MRTERYQGLLPVERLAQTACTIIGVGAIGRQVALQLAAMGIGTVQLVDFDRVETTNLGTQAYLEDDIGLTKVKATSDLMFRLNAGLSIENIPKRFGRSMEAKPVVFCCVDSITARQHIWKAVQDQASVFIDGRMAAEVLRVLTVSNGDSRERYPETLFTQGDAYEAACTARSTVYCANLAAGIMVSQFTKWLRGFPTDFEVGLNLLSMELDVQ